MDFGNAALLSFAAFLVANFLKAWAKKFGWTMDDAETLTIVILAGIFATILVSHSAWGHKQVVSGISLDTMNWWSQLLVGLAVGGLANLGHFGITRGIANIGQNQTSPPQ